MKLFRVIFSGGDTHIKVKSEIVQGDIFSGGGKQRKVKVESEKWNGSGWYSQVETDREQLKWKVKN